MSFFVGLGTGFSDLLAFENKLENKAIFYEEPDLETWIWWRRSGGNFGL